MQINANTKILDLIAIFDCLDHKFHNKKVRVARLCQNGKLKIRTVNEDGSNGEIEDEEVTVWNLRFKESPQGT